MAAAVKLIGCVYNSMPALTWQYQLHTKLSPVVVFNLFWINYLFRFSKFKLSHHTQFTHKMKMLNNSASDRKANLSDAECFVCAYLPMKRIKSYKLVSFWGKVFNGAATHSYINFQFEKQKSNSTCSRMRSTSRSDNFVSSFTAISISKFIS